MIIELFGPPAAGKTTIARSLTRRLREAGHVVEPIISNRPAEWDGAATGQETREPSPSLMRRLARPIAQAGAALFATAASDQIQAKLMALDPPTSVIWRVRLKRYLTQLSQSWSRASRAGHIVLFDQAYVQFACSLMLLGRKDEDEELHRLLLGAIPKSDLLVGITAPRATLEQRLQDRLRSQKPLERLLEFDLKTNLESIGVIARLEEGLTQSLRPVISVSSVDQQSATFGLAAVERKLAKMPYRDHGAASP